MKNAIALVVIATSLLSGACVAQTKSATTAPMSDKEQISSLIRQNQILMEENTKLKEQSGRARTKEENFTVCMQATKGQTNAMAAESIGGHCAQLLK